MPNDVTIQQEAEGQIILSVIGPVLPGYFNAFMSIYGMRRDRLATCIESFAY